MSFFQRVLKGLSRQPPTPQERRQGGRLPAHGYVTLLWQNTRQQDRRTRADVIETSERGLSIRTKRAVPVGREAAVTNGLTIVHGMVRHCERHGRECTLGIEILNRQELPEESRQAYPFSDIEL